MIPGALNPKTGERWTFAEHLVNIVRLGQFLHDQHGASQMTIRAALEYVIKQYRAREDQDIDDFWRLRPDLKPADWAEHRDEYLSGDARAWERLAWDGS